jgi:hypothetical protein
MPWQFAGVFLRGFIQRKPGVRWIALIFLVSITGIAAVLLISLRGNRPPISLVLSDLTVDRWRDEQRPENERRFVAWFDLKNNSKNSITYRGEDSNIVEYAVLEESVNGWTDSSKGFRCGIGIQNFVLQPGGQLRFEAILHEGSRVKVAIEFFRTNSKNFGDYMPWWLVSRVAWLGRWKTITSDIIDLQDEAVVRLLKCGKGGLTDEQRLAQEEFEMAGKYFSGSHGEKNRPKGIELYGSAALHGNVEAAYNLGVIYEHGLGVSLDLDKAKGWYLNASQAGHVLARERVVALGKEESSLR